METREQAASFCAKESVWSSGFSLVGGQLRGWCLLHDWCVYRHTPSLWLFDISDDANRPLAFGLPGCGSEGG